MLCSARIQSRSSSREAWLYIRIVVQIQLSAPIITNPIRWCTYGERGKKCVSRTCNRPTGNSKYPWQHGAKRTCDWLRLRPRRFSSSVLCVCCAPPPPHLGGGFANRRSNHTDRCLGATPPEFADTIRSVPLVAPADLLCRRIASNSWRAFGRLIWQHSSLL